MSVRYGALEAQGGDVGDSPTQRLAALSSDSRATSPTGEKLNSESKGRSIASNLLSLPVALHIGVLALYVALCVIWITGVEQNIQVALTRASRVQTWLNLTSHLIMLAFSTAIIAVMQPFATCSPFGNLPQPLTSISDKISSWNGLGSSLISFYYNCWFPVTLNSTIVTAVYFLAMSGLGITSSYLFVVPPFNETISQNMTTRVGSPSLSGLALWGHGGVDKPSDFTDLSFDWYRSGMGVNSDNASVYPGLTGNRIYDTILSPTSDGSNASAMVGYTDFHVKCGSVPNVSISAKSSNQYFRNFTVYNSSSVNGSTTYEGRYFTYLSINYPLGTSLVPLQDGLSIAPNDTSHAVSRLRQPSDVLLRVPNSGVLPGFARNLILYNIYNETGLVSGSQPLLDSQGSPGSPWPLHFAVNPGSGGGNVNTSLMVQVIGCSLLTSEGLATIDATTNQLLDFLSTAQAGSSRSNWTDWKPDITMSNALEDTWASMFLPATGSVALWDSSPVPLGDAIWSCLSYPHAQWPSGLDPRQKWNASQLQDTYEACHVPTVIEDYLTTRLFGPVTGRDAYLDAVRDPSSANATLSALESELAAATAKVMWSAARASSLTVTSHDMVYLPGSQFVRSIVPVFNILVPTNGSALVVEQVVVWRIAFNDTVLIAGTILAAILTALGMYILVQADAVRIRDAPINDAGLLSLMTLDNSAIAARLSASGMDSVKARRRAGAFLVEIVDGRLVPIEETD